jgi:hypothetical protein
MFGLVGNEANSIAHKTNVELYDANYRREKRKIIYGCGSPGGSTIHQYCKPY